MRIIKPDRVRFTTECTEDTEKFKDRQDEQDSKKNSPPF
jgi:hypothetical protein